MKLVTIVLFVSITLSTTLVLSSCDNKEKVVEEIIRPVRYQKVFLAGSEVMRTFSGLSKAGTETKLSFRVGGVLNTVNVQLGEKVRKDQLVASVDDSDAQLTYEKALAAMKKAETQKQNAGSNLKRVRELYENNNVALSEYEKAKDQYATANSSYTTEKRNSDLKKRELGYYKLYAPMDGVIINVPVEKNEQVSPGQVVAEISSKNDIEVTVGMPEAFIQRVKLGDVTKIKFTSLPDRVFDGIVSEVSFSAGAESSTYPVIIKLQQSLGDIRPGMTADVTFNFTSGEKKKHIVIPAHAVAEDSEGNYVFTVIAGENGLAIVNKKYVMVGTLTREGYEISSGLKDGELVVSAGIANLSDGMKVRVLK